MQLQTKNKTYDIEFTFEAAESDDVQKAFDYFSGAYMLKSVKTTKPEEEMTEEEKVETRVAQMDAMVSGISIIPKLAIDFLFMGLLENHGTHTDGDGSVACRDDAKRIYKQFCKENPDSVLSKQTGLFDALRDQMETDGFFDRIGITQMLEMMKVPEAPLPKTPQDHKKKSTKPSSNG